MWVWTNRLPIPMPDALPAAGGWILPADVAVVSVRDRGLLLGDGLFETIRVHRGNVPLLSLHLGRLAAGCAQLGIPKPSVHFESAIRSLLAFANTPAGDPDLESTMTEKKIVKQRPFADGFLRITVTRGPGKRGYEPPEDPSPLVLIHIGPWTPPARPLTAKLYQAPFPIDPRLFRVKHLSALRRVLLKAEAKRWQVEELLLVNPSGCLVEGIASNLFWVRRGELVTPEIDCGCLPGLARAFVMGERPVRTGMFSPDELSGAEEIFLTNALAGVLPVREIPGLFSSPAAPGKVARSLQAAWSRLLKAGQTDQP